MKGKREVIVLSSQRDPAVVQFICTKRTGPSYMHERPIRGYQAKRMYRVLHDLHVAGKFRAHLSLGSPGYALLEQ